MLCKFVTILISLLWFYIVLNYNRDKLNHPEGQPILPAILGASLSHVSEIQSEA